MLQYLCGVVCERKMTAEAGWTYATFEKMRIIFLVLKPEESVQT
jgi:hypothetical protein